MFDLLLKGGRIVSGTGDPWFYGDIGVKGDTIKMVAPHQEQRTIDAHRIIDATGMVVCPGFIDMHTHSDLALLADPYLEPKVRQGITTELLGQDGLSYAPLSPTNLQMMRRYLIALNGDFGIPGDWTSVQEYLARLDQRVSPNVAFLVPHCALRLETMGFVDRLAQPDELKEMQRIVARSMKEGAFGISFGLDYCPGRYSDTHELIAICEEVAARGGITVWHKRKQDLGLLESLDEICTVAEKTGVKTHISHLATSGPANQGKSRDLLARIDRCREQGLDITFDAYPYIASQTSLILIFPGWVHNGGPDTMLERLGNPKTKKQICTELNTADIAWDKLIIAGLGKEENEVYVGKSLAEAAKTAGQEPAEFVCQLFYEENLNVGFIGMGGHEEDVRRIMQHPAHTVGSDGVLVGQKPNPRGYGTFPRLLGHYCREEKLLPMEEMIRHLTSAPAQCLGLTDRGLLKPGIKADLVVFDPDNIKDTATFENPAQYPQGIKHVVINGCLVIDHEKHTGALPGRALTSQYYRA